MPKIVSPRTLSIALTMLTCVCAALLTSSALAWWNTGVVLLRNQSGKRVRFIPKHGGTYPDFEFNDSIAAYSNEDFDGEIMSWCDNTQELDKKGWRIDFEVSLDKFVPVARLCQNYRDNIVYLVLEGSSWDARIPCATRAYSYIDVTVRADGTLFCSG